MYIESTMVEVCRICEKLAIPLVCGELKSVLDSRIFWG